MRECSAASPAPSLKTGTTIDRPVSLRPRGRIGVVPAPAVLMGMAAIQPQKPPQASRIYSAKGRRLSRDAFLHSHRHREWQRARVGCGTMGSGRMNGYSAGYRQGTLQSALDMLRQLANEVAQFDFLDRGGCLLHAEPAGGPLLLFWP